MTARPEILEPLRFPLRGSRLVEASAGTGKTFTIAALYVRLVLQHGGPAAFPRALTPPEILVVTFTEAATKELRDRIRARLSEAAALFAEAPDPVDKEPNTPDLLHLLRDSYSPAQWPACARTLQLAAEWMDEAAVSTIHGWCNRMLSEHAFDSGSLFTQRLETDQRELYAEAVRDYWRWHVAPLALDDAKAVSKWWATPAALEKPAKDLLGLTHALTEGLPPEQALLHAREDAADALAALKAPWCGAEGWSAELLGLLDAAVAAKQCKMVARKKWMTSLREWAEGEAPWPALTVDAFKRLSPQGMTQEWTGDDSLHSHPAMQACGALPAALKALPDGRDEVLRHAAHWVAARVASAQSRLAQMGFNELLTRLDAALQGPNGDRLAGLIRQQFPVALIDEFQDTDPLQYRIFDRIYSVAENAQDTALILIGDPKQAIYAFRGADIHTYLAARKDTAGRHSTLATNFRSTDAMVESVNRVFEQAEQRPEGAGAFLFRSSGSDPLPFFGVQANGLGERWWVEDAAAPALTCWGLQSESAISAAEALRQVPVSCVAEIVRLLNLGTAGRAGFLDDKGKLTPVQPGDIAVLVNSGREAKAIRQALQARRVRSVYLSDRGSVFHTAAAGDIQRWLAACASPDVDRPLRAALGTATLALDWSALDQLSKDELQWEARVLQFRGYQGIWQRQGVLPMLRRLLNDFQVPQRLLLRHDERTLTDVLHLAELLQQASAQLDGEHALIRWLAGQREDASDENDARKLRLESDAALVKVVTVHKSKGLEYPLVFFPFATSFRTAKPDDLPLKWHDAEGRLVVGLRADAEVLAHVERERLGEDLRKLYVALTRARHATWIGVAPLAQVEHSALGYLLSGGRPLSPAALAVALHAMVQTVDGIVVDPIPEASAEIYTPNEQAGELCVEPSLPQVPPERWWIASYSALRHDATKRVPTVSMPPQLLVPGPLPATPTSAAEDIYADSVSDSERPFLTDARATPDARASRLHDFPRGAGAGSFLHGLLEWVGRKGFQQVAADPSVQADLADLIARRCNLSGWDRWVGPLRGWLEGWLSTPLQLGPVGPTEESSLAVAPSTLGRVQIEMEFWLSVARVDTLELDALVRLHTLGGAPRPALQAQQVNGMLKGFIDLVFEYEGRYFVADYKSNWLGPDDAHYTPAAMRDAVLEHRYDLQYALYVFALHRHLRARIPDYDYDRHVGGAVYLFLRGHAAPGQGLHAERPPRALVEGLDRLFCARDLARASGPTQELEV